MVAIHVHVVLYFNSAETIHGKKQQLSSAGEKMKNKKGFIQGDFAKNRYKKLKILQMLH